MLPAGMFDKSRARFARRHGGAHRVDMGAGHHHHIRHATLE
jgi:hypothetical protein